jgi:hypothetical protein
MKAAEPLVEGRIREYLAPFSLFRRPEFADLDALPSIPDAGGPVDTVSLLTGSESFCADLLIEPEAAAEALAISGGVFNRLARAITREVGPESSDWLSLYCAEGYWTVGEDMTALVSPTIVRECFTPHQSRRPEERRVPLAHWSHAHPGGRARDSRDRRPAMDLGHQPHDESAGEPPRSHREDH